VFVAEKDLVGQRNLLVVFSEDMAVEIFLLGRDQVDVGIQPSLINHVWPVIALKQLPDELDLLDRLDIPLSQRCENTLVLLRLFG